MLKLSLFSLCVLLGGYAEAQQQGGAVTLFQGYVGSQSAYGWYARNQAAGVGQDLKSGYGNYGVAAVSAPTGGGTGIGAGILGLAAFNDRNIGLLGRSTEYKVGASNVGGAVFALNVDSGGVPSGKVTGFYFALSLPPTSKAAFDAELIDAAILIDNKAQAVPVIVARNNGVPVFEVPLAGQMQLHQGSLTQPTCDAAHRGAFFLTESGSGVADRLEACGKDAADAYSWKAVAIF